MAPRGSSQRNRRSSFSSRLSSAKRNSVSRADSSSRPSQPKATRATSGQRRPRISSHGETLDTAPGASTVISRTAEYSSTAGHEQEIDLEADDLNEIVMAVDVRDSHTVGCAYYVAREEKLYFMEDVRCGGVDTIESCEQCGGRKTGPSLMIDSETSHRAHPDPHLDSD
jgi:DNA mismatch repair protein MSH5